VTEITTGQLEQQTVQHYGKNENVTQHIGFRVHSDHTVSFSAVESIKPYGEERETKRVNTFAEVNGMEAHYAVEFATKLLKAAIIAEAKADEARKNKGWEDTITETSEVARYGRAHKTS